MVQKAAVAAKSVGLPRAGSGLRPLARIWAEDVRPHGESTFPAGRGHPPARHAARNSTRHTGRV